MLHLSLMIKEEIQTERMFLSMLHYTASALFRPDFEFSIKQQLTNKPTYTHTHDYIEMVYVVEGNGKHMIDEAEYPLQRGGFFMIDLGHSHNLIFEKEAHYYDLYFSKEFLETFYPICEKASTVSTLFLGEHWTPATYFDTQQIPGIEYILVQLNNEAAFRKQFSKSYLCALLSLLFLEIFRQNTTRKKTVTPHNSALALPRIADYINQHFTESIKLKDVAQKYNYNPAYFGRLFKKTYAMSFEDYIKLRRLEYAGDLLISTTLPIDTIIARTGYNNRSFFFQEFQKKYHCTPNEYRLRHLKAQDSDFLDLIE